MTHKSAFSLIEVLISVVTLAICLVAMAVVFAATTIKLVNSANQRDAEILLNNIQQMEYAGYTVPDKVYLNNIVAMKVDDKYAVAFKKRSFQDYTVPATFTATPSIVPPNLENYESDFYISPNHRIFTLDSVDGSLRFRESIGPRDLGRGLQCIRPLAYKLIWKD